MQKPKPGYRLVKSLFGKYEEIPDDWEIKNISSIVDITMGQSPPSENYNEDQKGLPFYQGVTDFGTMYPNPTIWCTDSRKIAEKNSILFSVRAPVGEVNLTKTKCCLGRGVAALNPLKNDLWYCYYLVNQNKNRFLVFSQGTTYDAINQGEIAKTRLPYTKNIHEQQKIASILSNMDNLIESYDSIIQNIVKLKHGLMQQLLTKGIGHKKFKKVKSLFGKYEEIPDDWEYVKLIETCSKNPEYGAGESALEKDPKLPRYVRITDLNDDGSLRNEEWKSISNDAAKNYLLTEGDILFARTGATVGKTYLYQKKDGRCAFAGYLIRFIPEKSRLIPSFLFQITHSTFYWKWLKSIQTWGVQPNVNAEQYSKMPILLPPMQEQQKIVSILSTVDSKINDLETKKFNIESLKKGLMQKLLTGQIRV